MKVSIIVPAYNEAPNIPHLIEALSLFLKGRDGYEVIIVDDGSDDGTGEKAKGYLDQCPWLKVASHRRNLGKTEAIQTGYRVSKGKIIVIFDADLQYDPADIPKMVERIDSGYDLICGRRIGYYEKKTVSRIYYWLAKRLFKIQIHDLNAMKAMRREVIESITMRKDWHRFIVPLAAEAGFRIGELDVKLRPRRYGQPKYSSRFRILIGFFDLLAVKFQQSFLKKPMFYFGLLGSLSFLLGLLIGIVAIILRLFGIGLRPLLYLVILLILAGLLLFGLALIGETSAHIIDHLNRIEKRFDDHRNRDKI
ncbi:glycosyltransferase [candidate division WOR-3 bacterium]|uniref:Glycosyltransferase n=1 Tax=candidate division WOR-3 bacterium TaxID=2052148 RepID=A0A660SDQ0_UNCW3|nr:MAG: glycosyltransferase [candidate division WOR-3 bacterium]